jgi:hypothetical protein
MMLIHPTLPNGQQQYLCPDTFSDGRFLIRPFQNCYPLLQRSVPTKPEKPGNRLPFQAPKSDFPLLVIHPYPSPGRTFSPAIIPHTETILVMKTPSNPLARFGAYPGSRIFLTECVQNFPIIVIIDQARIGYLNLYNSSGSINRLSDVF